MESNDERKKEKKKNERFLKNNVKLLIKPKRNINDTGYLIGNLICKHECGIKTDDVDNGNILVDLNCHWSKHEFRMIPLILSASSFTVNLFGQSTLHTFGFACSIRANQPLHWPYGTIWHCSQATLAHCSWRVLVITDFVSHDFADSIR
ncbi:hypothetical protein BLOT_008886 [Blomia tropicalis]|nr:hypothetical protein BLOT_008886 [Blomia tropicalis]